MWAYQMDVAQPIEMYDRVRGELLRKLGKDTPDSCLLHMVVRLDSGFRVIEVWESHEAADRFGNEVLRPTIEEVVGPQAGAEGPPPSEELDLHVLRMKAGTPAEV